MIFDHWTYNQFYMERTSWSAEQKAPIHFTKEEIEWAIEQTEYKYFGEYCFTDQQEMAVEILVWAAKSQMLIGTRIAESVDSYERLGEVTSFEGQPLIYAQVLLDLGDLK